MNDSASKPSKVTRIEIDGDIATIIFNRPEKRNAMNDALIDELDAFFSAPPKSVTAVILRGEGGHFCSGLDLAEHEHRAPVEGVFHSRNWHRVSELIEFGGLPVISVLTGAVIGGGLEIAASTHVRIAEPTVRFQLPEGRRGIFVGGGATVRVGRLLGPDRMREMMLTGRNYGAEDGLRLGLAAGTKACPPDIRQCAVLELSDDQHDLTDQRHVSFRRSVHRKPCRRNEPDIGWCQRGPARLP
jgi:enoyl-CoA hydratase/carnithine racemase